MHINAKRRLLAVLARQPMTYAQLRAHGLSFTQAGQLVDASMIRRIPGPSGVYEITPQGRRWLNLQRGVA